MPPPARPLDALVMRDRADYWGGDHQLIYRAKADYLGRDQLIDEAQADYGFKNSPSKEIEIA
jgi:hypothetical protein